MNKGQKKRINKKNKKNSKGVEYIKHKGEVVGLCVRNYYKWNETKFLTSDKTYQQIGLLSYDKDSLVRPHAHYEFARVINFTQEVLFCVSGRILYTFYDVEDNWTEIGSCELASGDLLCLFGAGHGAKALEPTRLIEVKQGPFLGTKDKFFKNEYGEN